MPRFFLGKFGFASEKLLGEILPVKVHAPPIAFDTKKVFFQLSKAQLLKEKGLGEAQTARGETSPARLVCPIQTSLALFPTIQAAPRFELGVKDLQSSALPLGHATRKIRLVNFYHKILQESNFP